MINIGGDQSGHPQKSAGWQLTCSLNCEIMGKNSKLGPKLMLLAGLLASSVVFPAAYTRADQPDGKLEATPPLATSPSAASPGGRPLSAVAMLPKEKRYYQATWGVDILGIKTVSSGLMLRFSYLVLDANKAKVLNDKKLNPALIDTKSGSKLVIPTLEKVGQLRQSSTPENGHQYWMVFSNRGTLVKPGDKVDIVIGSFRASGLTVQ